MQTPRASGIQISSSVRFIKTNLQSIAVSTTTRRAWSISMSGFVVGSVDVTYPFQFGASKASGNLSGSDIEDVSTVINSSLFTCGIGIYTAGTTAYLDSLSTSDSRGFSVN